MRYLFTMIAIIFAAPAGAADLPTFKAQEIDTGLKIGYAVLATDIDGDKRPDLVVVDQHKVVWYRNPGTRDGEWKKFTILDGKTRPDNVCIADIDIDGDGLPELVLGAAWKPFDTTNAGQLVWLKRGKDVTQEWTMHELPCDEPNVHRVRVADINGNGKPSIIVAPLLGRGATEEGDWTNGRPVRIVALEAPEKDPEKKENWKVCVLSNEFRVVQNIDICFQGTARTGTVASILTASDKGVHALWVGNGQIQKHNPIALRDKDKPDGSKAARDVRYGLMWPTQLNKGTAWYDAAIESRDGSELAVYPISRGIPRILIDQNFRGGKAIRCADLDGDGADELILGVHDNPNPKAGDRFRERRGVRFYKCVEENGKQWERRIIDDGGIAVEDLAVADLDGDGKIDIVAVGRSTRNCRIYWNQGK